MSFIQSIEWIDVEYDDTLSHDIRGIATVYLKDQTKIDGILIYYPFSFNEQETYINAHERYEHDVKVWVKFPKSVKKSDEDKRHIAVEINNLYMDRFLSA